MSRRCCQLRHLSSMRKILSGFAVIIALLVAISIVWIFGGQRLSLFLDRFGPVELESVPVKSVSYEGAGTGGVLLINQTRLSLIPADTDISEVHVGTTKDGQFGLSYGGKVFAFGPVRSSENEALAASIEPADAASIATRHSYLGWLTFSRGQWPVWNRYDYYQLTWKKQNGARLEMVWKNGPNYYRDHGWIIMITMHGEITGLIRVDITNVAR
jgi:hypothetical protein